MHYVQLLGHLEDMTLRLGIQEFDSRNVSEFIKRMLAGTTILEARIMLKNVSSKRISNDLNRLYRMQLLSRKRVKRTCQVNRLADDGRKCGRGFMFKYSFTRQGLRYITYLKTKKNETAVEKAFRQQNDLLRDPNLLLSKVAVRQYLPSSLYSIDWKFVLFNREITNTETQYKGRYRRFPPSVDKLLMLSIMKFVKESKEKDEKIRQLEEEIHKMHESIRQERLRYAAAIKAAQDRLDRLFSGRRF